MKNTSGWIRCNVIIEVLGKPAEFLTKVLKKAVENLEKEEEICVINKEIHKPEPAENLFSAFMELELCIKDMKKMLDFIFTYMPSNIEIVEPKEMKMNLNDSNDFANRLIVKMHQYDAVAKRMNFENQMMKFRLQELGEIPKEIEEAEKVLKEDKDKKK